MSTALDQLLSLIAAGESLTLELKKSTAEKDRACRSLCALANGQGGYVVFGVTPTTNACWPNPCTRLIAVAAWKTPAPVTPLVCCAAWACWGGASAETLGKTLGKTQNLVLERLTEVPSTSIPELAQQLGKSASAVERAIRKLRTDGKLVRIGPAKGGHWQVVG